MPLEAIVVCGPSGVGKGTLLQRLLTQYATRFAYSISHTSRPPRAHETAGKEYHFAARDDIERMDAAGEFLEVCDVHGNLYGTSVAAVRAVRDQGKVCIIEIDVKGAEKLAARTANPISASYLFITAPSMEELRNRITKRGCDDDECVRRRLITAEAEMAFLQAHPTFFCDVILNDKLDEAYARLVAAISKKLVEHQMPALQ